MNKSLTPLLWVTRLFDITAPITSAAKMLMRIPYCAVTDNNACGIL